MSGLVGGGWEVGSITTRMMTGIYLAPNQQYEEEDSLNAAESGDGNNIT